MRDVILYLTTYLLCIVASYAVVRLIVHSMPDGWSDAKYTAAISLFVVILAAIGLHGLVLRALKIKE